MRYYRSLVESANVTCTASSSLGSASAVTEIDVLGPGSPPDAVRIVVDGDVLSLSWSKPLISNGEIKVSRRFKNFPRTDCTYHQNVFDIIQKLSWSYVVTRRKLIFYLSC